MNNQFKDNLKKIRKEHNLSQEQLAEELGVSRQAISKWESGTAYPEMDKIIFLCEKFNVNIDDLLHNDIKEVKSEEESKKSINKGIDDSLNFITDSINLFSKMTFGSKLKVIFEELILILLLILASHIIISLIGSLFSELIYLFPNKIAHGIRALLNSIIGIICFIFSIILLIRIFKMRYLDYYKKKIKESEKDNNKDKIEIKEEGKAVVIRDANDSSYSFLKILFNIILIIIKINLAFFALMVCAGIATSMTGVILSFLVYKTGIFFAGALATTISFSTAGVVLLLVILNFIFNRKISIKKLIWTFVISVIVFGVGCGLLSIGSLQFEVYKNDPSTLKVETKEFEMTEDLVIIYKTDKEPEYIEEDINNVVVDYSLNNTCELEIYNHNDVNNINYETECYHATKNIKEFLKNLNNNKIVAVDYQVNKIVIHASKENIEKLKNNYENYKIEQEESRDLIKHYNEEIDKLKEELDTCKNS